LFGKRGTVESITGDVEDIEEEKQEGGMIGLGRVHVRCFASRWLSSKIQPFVLFYTKQSLIVLYEINTLARRSVQGKSE
jgi:hypothetical protein